MGEEETKEFKQLEPSRELLAYQGEIQNTDLGNAKRLYENYGRIVRFDCARQKFLIYNKKYWEYDETGKIYQAAEDVSKQLYLKASLETDSKQRIKIGEWAKQSQSLHRIKAMAEIILYQYGIPVLPKDLDRNPFLLCVNNGVIDLKTGKSLPHDPDYFITKIAPVDYNPNAECPTFLKFLDEIMCGKEEVIKFIQKGVGYSLTGDTRERCFFILFGRGANGKSTFLNVIQALLGNMQYACNTPTETLMAKRHDTIPNDIARLKGMRFVTAIEGNEGRKLDEGRIKQVSGNDVMTARFMRGEWFDFYPQFKIWFATNHKPIIHGTDKAIWDRIRLIPFTVTIPEEKQDKQLFEKLRAELPGILRWAVDGCSLWQLEGLNAPEDVRSATLSYRDEMDVLKSFLDECCVADRQYQVQSKKIYERYKRWCEVVGENPLHQKTFSLRISERGFDKIRRKTGNYWIGIGLIDG